ncbi:MAG: hypothetical protein MZW92_05620 [Comamonadaceae bacterium]|nr:hypothetical protein [Comamonadaceae bacterium]
MPYYIYKVHQPLRNLEKVEEHDAFRAASDRAKQMRREIPAGQDYLVKVIHAENELQAEDLLSQVREKEPLTGDDW